MKRLYTLFIYISIVFCAHAQGIISLNSDQGLSNTCIYTMLEDSYQNVWISTRNGLNRYDGAKIRTFRHITDQPNSISCNIITALVENVPGTLIIGTDTGLELYEYADDCFSNIPILNENRDTLTGRVISCSSINDERAIACLAGIGVALVSRDKDGQLVARLTRDYWTNGYPPMFTLQASDGKVWILNTNYEVFYRKGNKTHQVPVEGRAWHLAEGSNGDIYTNISQNGMFRYDSRLDRFVHINDEHKTDPLIIKNLRSNNAGQIYVCTDGDGLHIYDEKTGSLEQSKVKTNEFNLATSNIEDAMLDSRGNLWIGVYWKGIVIQPQRPSAFEYVGRRSGSKNSIGTNCVTALASDVNGWMWVGTDHCGLYHVSPDGTESEHYKPGEVPNVPGTISAIYKDENGILWLGSSIGEMVCFNPATRLFTPVRQLNPDASVLQKVYSIVADRRQKIWMATMGEGIYGYDVHTGKIDHYLRNAGEKDSDGRHVLSNMWCGVITVDNDLLYVGHANGFDCLAIRADGTLTYRRTYLPGNVVNSIKVDNKGDIWVGSSTGLYRYDRKGDELTLKSHLSEKDGLSNDMIRSIEIYDLSDTDYELWLSTDNGLNCYAPAKNTFRRFYISDGLQGNEFTERASLLIDNRLIFGGINGLNYFLPSDVVRSSDERSSTIRLVDIYLGGKPVRAGQKSGRYVVYQGWIDHVNLFEFAHSDNNVSIELATNMLSTYSTFEYSLDGGKWQSAGNTQNRIVLNNLHSGSHKLSIRSVSNGVYSEERQIVIRIHSAWYQSWWAYLFYLALFMVLLYIVINTARTRVQAQRLLMQHKQEEEIAEARIQFFMNISHEIRTPMTLILAPLEKLRSLGDDEDHQKSYNIIYQNAQRILTLINQMMDVRKIERGQFQLEYTHVELVSFSRNLYDLFLTTANRRNIQFDYEHSHEQVEAILDSPALDKILMNLLSNAFKFTSDGGHIKLQLRYDETAGQVVYRVTDDGVGIPGSDKSRIFQRFYSTKHQNGYIGTGIGLNLTWLLVQLHEGTIVAEDNPDGKGTVLTVTLPVRPTKEDAVIIDTGVKPAAEQRTQVIDRTQARRHRNLMIVEDDAEIRHYLHQELASDFSIIECSNGQEAWEFVQKSPDKVDLIISDIMMPVMEGTTLCEKVKSNFTTNQIPVILLTAKNTDNDRIAGLSIGADAYMTKPFNVEVLRTTALNILQNHQMLRSHVQAAETREQKIEKVDVVSPDEHLMNRVMKCINENMSNPEMSVEMVADTVGVSRVHFHRKIKELAGQTPRDFIRNIRLEQAARLLREKHLDITDVSIATGFRSLSTFSSSFKSVYGMTPTEYMNTHQRG